MLTAKVGMDDAMDYTPKRAARFRHMLTFAALAFQYANLAHATAPDITFTPATLDFQYQAGAALPASQTLQIKSSSATTALAFTLSITGPVPYLAQWLSLSGNSGTTSASVKAYVNPTGLPSGSYTGTILVTAPGALASPYSFPVTLEVADAPSTLVTNTTTLTFTYLTGSAPPAPQAIVLMSSGDALSASITVTGTWLSASPTGSITLVGLPGTVTVTVDPTGLPPGAYTGRITFASPTAVDKSLIVNVTLSIDAGTPTVSNVWPPGVLVNSTAVIATLTGTNYFSTSSAAITAAVPPATTPATTTLTTTVLSPTVMLVTIPASLLTTAQSLPIVITTPTGAPSAPANFVVYAPGPQLWAVADSASYAVSGVSPGEIITIFGIGLGPAALVMYPGTSPLPDSLPATEPNTSVTIDALPAPILYTSANQVSCIAPYGLVTDIGGAAVNLVLTYNSIASTPFPVNIVAADPGVFSMNESGTGQGAILNFNSTSGDYTVNSSTNAAVKGNIVVIYVTGYGQTNPAGDETTLIAAGTPVVPVAAVSVTIGGLAATVQAAQAPVGSVAGVLQINVVVPLTVTSGNTVPVLVTVTPTGGTAVSSQAKVTMAVK
jgi:uncharacterized protein (TIGR03437 family)